MISRRIVAAAFIAACRDELEAPKPGNVHVYASGHRMTAAQFADSAAAAADPLCAPGARVGARIRGAVEATLRAVGANTNLGIVLLCAPLAAAAERDAPKLRDALVAVLDDLISGTPTRPSPQLCRRPLPASDGWRGMMSLRRRRSP